MTMIVEPTTASQPLPREASSPRRRTRLSAPGPRAVAFVVFLAAAYFIYPESQVNVDTHLFLTVSIVDRGALNIDPFSRLTEDIASWHGHHYTDKAPGLSLLGAPVYALTKLVLLHGQPFTATLQRTPVHGMDVYVRYILALAFAAVPTAIIAWLLYKLLGRMGASRGWCAGLALTYGLGTIARPFAGLFFSHQFSALLCFGAFALAFRLRREEISDRFALVIGLLLGYTLITEYPAAIAAAAIAAYVLAIPRRGRRLGLGLGLGVLPSLVIGAVYNTLAFGNPLRIGYGHLAGPMKLRIGQAQGLFGVTYPHLDAIWGTTFSPYRGLFFLSPVLLLALPACVALVRRPGWRAEGLLCGAIAGGFLLFNMSYFAWTGGASMGPRQLLASVPFFVLPLGELVRSGRSLGWRRVTGALAGYSIALVELCAAVSPIFGENFISPVRQWVLPHLAGMRIDFHHPDGTQARLAGALLRQLPVFIDARLEFNWGQRAGLPGLIQLYPLAMVIALALLWPTLAERALPRARAMLSSYRARRPPAWASRLVSLIPSARRQAMRDRGTSGPSAGTI